MIYKNLTTKELYTSIPNPLTIITMMKDGIKQGSTQLAVSAMEELIVRGMDDPVGDVLSEALKNGQLKAGTSMFAMITRSLDENSRSCPRAKIKLGKAIIDIADTSKVTLKESPAKEQGIKTLQKTLQSLTRELELEARRKAIEKDKLYGYFIDDDGNPIPDPNVREDKTTT